MVGYNERLDIRPKYQREFVYKDDQRDEVIRTALKGFPLTLERGWWDMGIVIYAPVRGRGYGKDGLRLLIDRAFRTAGVSRLHNEFETTRGAAYRIHKAAGFRESGTENGNVHLLLTREEYLK